MIFAKIMIKDETGYRIGCKSFILLFFCSYGDSIGRFIGIIASYLKNCSRFVIDKKNE